MTPPESLHPLPELQRIGVRDVLDLHFADLVGRAAWGEDAGSSPDGRPERLPLILAAALAQAAVRRGNSCIDLRKAAGKPAAPLLDSSRSGDGDGAGSGAERGFLLPSWEAWRAALAAPEARRVVGADGEEKPLILVGSRLYLRRYRLYELRVAELLRRRLQAGRRAVSEAEEECIRKLFRDCNELQTAAARSVLQGDFAILSGGPGTGKTYAMARIIALLVQTRRTAAPMAVALAAPTGKAAVRMVESIRNAKSSMDCPPEVLRQIPEEAVTIHRLLGFQADSAYFRDSRGNPLAADLVVVDEASMIDLPLMAKLLDAVPDRSKLLLIGDTRQLTSVEPGKVFCDLCDIPERHPEYRGILTRLTESRRFGEKSDVGVISRAIESEAPEDCWSAALRLRESFFVHDDDSPEWMDPDRDGDPDFRSLVEEGYRELADAPSPEEALRTAGRFRVLCALRHGPYGVVRQNRRIERILRRGHPEFRPTQGHYPRQMIMILENTPQLRLFNGDVGIVMDDGNGQLEACFHDDGRAGNPLRRIPVYMLPRNETAFAMTIHKSQGSEFTDVAMILPPDETCPLLTRELIYTGITRTRRRLHLWCTRRSFTTAVAHATRRESGLELDLRRSREDA